MNIVYIHGANATSKSFNYIRSKLGNGIDIDYDSRNGFENNLKAMQSKLAGQGNLVFVAHSLGGIYSLHLANMMPMAVKGAITLSTPYGGAKAAEVVKLFLPFSRLMQDISPSSWAMKQASRMQILHPWTNIVTVIGQSPFIHEPNDGVVTIASQRHHADMELVEVDCNHYEVVLSDAVVDLIEERVNKFN
jgi:pimeloyl-ACP methyl ester carboxylesterase